MADVRIKPGSSLQGLSRPELPPSTVDAASQLRRMRQRMYSIRAEDPLELARYTHRLSALLPAPWAKVFGEQRPAQVLAQVATSCPGLQFRPDDVLATGLRPKDAGGDALGIIGVLSKQGSGEPVGFFFQTFTVGLDGKVRDFIDYVIGTAPGQGQAMTQVTDALAKRAGSVRSELKTAWLGRYYWAQKGYDFATPSERQRVMEHFRQFLRYYRRDHEALFIPRGINNRNIALGEQLSAVELAQVQGSKGPITIPALVGHGEATPAPAPLGKAFLLGDWRDPATGHLFVRNWLGAKRR